MSFSESVLCLAGKMQDESSAGPECGSAYFQAAKTSLPKNYPDVDDSPR